MIANSPQNCNFRHKFFIMHHHRLLWFCGIGLMVLLPLMIGGCNESGICLSNQHAVQVSLISAHTGKDTTLTTSVFGAGRSDSVYASQALSKLFLPLEFDHDPDTTFFVIKTKTTADTLAFLYRKELDFISGECGYVFSFTIDGVAHTTNKIDYSTIVYPTVKYGEDLTNVQVYIY